MEEYVQDFKRAVRESGYVGYPLIEEFKRGMNRAIRRKLMEAEKQPGSIEQWFKRAIALDRNWKESRREKERIREIEKRQEQKRINEKWRRIEKIRIIEEKKADKEWRHQEIWERKREENRQRAMEERKCFRYRGFGHIVSHCRNKREKKLI